MFVTVTLEPSISFDVAEPVASVYESNADIDTSYVMSPSSMLSLAPVIVSTCGVCQSLALNTKLVDDSMPSAALPLLTFTDSDTKCSCH